MAFVARVIVDKPYKWIVREKDGRAVFALDGLQSDRDQTDKDHFAQQLKQVIEEISEIFDDLPEDDAPFTEWEKRKDEFFKDYVKLVDKHRMGIGTCTKCGGIGVLNIADEDLLAYLEEVMSHGVAEEGESE